MKFFTIKRGENRYEGMFIAPNEIVAREIARKNGFKIDDDTVFEDVSVERTEAEKKNSPILGGSK